MIKFLQMSGTCLEPTRATRGSAGYDLYADLQSPDHCIEIPEHQIRVISTGVQAVFASDHVALICSRSGLASKHGVIVINAPGVVDSDYENPIQVALINLGQKKYTIKHGDRIAQLLIVPHSAGLALHAPERTGGLGSTGR